MGQKTSPIGFRTGITLGWQSTWFAPKANYGDFLVEDQKIRQYVDRRFNRQMPKGAVAKVEIIRTRNEVNVTLHSGRPGVVIGPRGGEVDKLREELEALTSRKVTVNVIEIKEPDLNAMLVAEGIGEQLSKRASFRRTMKQFCESAMNAGAKGVKIVCSGRLAGAEMARQETQKMGSIPLHTLDADVDYSTATARTTYGAIGIKVWIYRGKFGEETERTERRRQRRPMRGRGPMGPSSAPGGEEPAGGQEDAAVRAAPPAAASGGAGVSSAPGPEGRT
ncbi:MAG: 30S ribosomal protein S3 [Planctomycetes bacterium RBG_13_62_9]|nr:MAG: 30S ribosomal protein S3 [Planctomycetes bacterium RBG_13_62_9]